MSDSAVATPTPVNGADSTATTANQSIDIAANDFDRPIDEELASLPCSVDPNQTVAAHEPGENVTHGDLEQAHVTLASIRRLLLVLCTLASIWVLNFAQAVLIPIALSIVLYLLLRPAVRWMQRRHIPETVGATLCLLVVAATVAIGILPLVGPAREWLGNLPEHLKHADSKLRVIREQMGHFSDLQNKIAGLASGEEAENPAQPRREHPVPVVVQHPELTSGTVMLSTTGNTLGMILVVVVLTFFLLVSGDQLINNVLSVLPTFHEKRQTVELILEVQKGISSYLVTITGINVGLGLVVGVALWLLGVPNPAVWGLLTTVFNYVPFVGQGAAGLLIALVALLSFDSLGYALLVPVVFYSIAAIEGNIITPALLGKHMSLSPIIVLVSLLFWGWTWGIAGAALAVPILAIAKLGCDRFECTRSIGTLLGG